MRVIVYVVGETYEKTKCISFNVWDKSQKWNGKMLKTGKIKSDKKYSCVISFEGSCFVNGKERLLKWIMQT